MSEYRSESDFDLSRDGRLDLPRLIFFFTDESHISSLSFQKLFIPCSAADEEDDESESEADGDDDESESSSDEDDDKCESLSDDDDDKCESFPDNDVDESSDDDDDDDDDN